MVNTFWGSMISLIYGINPVCYGINQIQLFISESLIAYVAYLVTAILSIKALAYLGLNSN